MTFDAFRAQLLSIRATADALLAQLEGADVDEPQMTDIREPLPAGSVAPAPPCKHKRTEPAGEFGPSAGQLFCSDCGVTVQRRR